MSWWKDNSGRHANQLSSASGIANYRHGGLVRYSQAAPALPLATALAFTLWTTDVSAQPSAETPAAIAQTPASTPALQADNGLIRISVLTFGPGKQAFAKFGHNALRVVDSRSGTDRVFNYGTFSFDDPMLVPKFLKGRLLYWLGVSDYRSTLRSYMAASRSVYEQVLALDAPTARAIAAELEAHAEERYLYDFYFDNCSTRVRDVLDRHLGRVLENAHSGAAIMSNRQNTLRLLAHDPLLYWALDFALGPAVDRASTQFDEMFLPERLQTALTTTRLGPVRQSVPLVQSERMLFEPASDHDVPAVAPSCGRLTALLAGGGIGIGSMSVGWLDPRSSTLWRRTLLGMVLFVIGIVVGLLGALQTYFVFFSDHAVAHANWNLLQAPVWALALSVFAVGVIRGQSRALLWARNTLAMTALSSMLGLVFYVTGLAAQDQSRILSATIPLWLGLTLGVHLLYRQTREVVTARGVKVQRAS